MLKFGVKRVKCHDRAPHLTNILATPMLLPAQVPEQPGLRQHAQGKKQRSVTAGPAVTVHMATGASGTVGQMLSMHDGSAYPVRAIEAAGEKGRHKMVARAVRCQSFHDDGKRKGRVGPMGVRWSMQG